MRRGREDEKMRGGEEDLLRVMRSNQDLIVIPAAKLMQD
jgi:hypothetical protein